MGFCMYICEVLLKMYNKQGFVASEIRLLFGVRMRKAVDVNRGLKNNLNEKHNIYEKNYIINVVVPAAVGGNEGECAADTG